jgi:protein-L-isoaspartate O-methyltransferase
VGVLRSNTLARTVAQTLRKLKYVNVRTKHGDGFLGWPEHAPFDKIIVTCSPERVPQPLITQLREGGRMVIPLGERYQQTLVLLKKVRVELNFFDQRRAPIGTAVLGRWYGTFDWQTRRTRVRVPVKSKLSVLVLGLFGATGQLSVDQVTVTVIDPDLSP